VPTPPSTDRGPRPGRGPVGLVIAAAAIAALVLAACARLGGLRPRYGPIPGSVSVELDGQPVAVIDSAASEVRSAGLTVALLDSAEGYLVTGWYDVVRRATVKGDGRDLDHAVRLRFFADPTGGKTRLAAECVRRIAFDPSEPEHDLERMVADSTPGRVLLDSIVARLKAAYPSAAVKPSAAQAP